MNTTDSPCRKTKVQRLKQQCGVYAIALYLKRRGYTLEQALALLNR